MELYTLKINVTNQRLSFGENPPEIYSGDQSIDFVEFTFTDDTWNFPNIWAIFYRQKGAAYQIALDDNKVIIPAEVMQKRGYIYIGLMATDGENVQTSSVLQYSIRQGAANVETVTPSPSIYEQFLADLDAYQEAIHNLETLAATAETLPVGSDATASYDNGVLQLGIPKGDTGATGNGILYIAKTASVGSVDTYTITYTNGNTTTFEVTNGEVTQGVFDDLVNEVTSFETWTGYPVDLFNARSFTVTNTNNWSMSATKTSLTFTHLTSYTTGQPSATLNLPSGTYIFKAANLASLTDVNISLYVNNSWVKTLGDNVEFTINNSDTNQIRVSSSLLNTERIVTGIAILEPGQTGIIQDIENSISILESEIDVANSDISELENGFSDITDPVIDEIAGTEQQDKAIGANGSIITAGATSYRIVTYSVVPNKTYWISGSANWGNYLWAFYDEDDAVVQLGTKTASGGTFEEISDTAVTAPLGSSYIVVAYHSTHEAARCKTQTGYTIKKKWDDKKWVVVGDSLTEVNARATKRYYDYVSEETGISVVNMGVSGTGYARGQGSNNAFYQRISAVPSDADVVTIFGSFNDLGAGLSIGSVDDSGTTTLAGCINTTIDNLQSIIPLVNLGIVAPTPWDTTQPTTSGTAYDYVNMLKAICERRSIPFLDLWHCSNLRPWDADFRALAYSHDGGSGTHPDENGHKLIAPRFKALLEALLI